MPGKSDGRRTGPVTGAGKTLINRLHIQAVWQQLSVKGESLTGVNVVETVFRNGVRKRYPACVPALSVSGYWKFGKKLSEVNDGKQKSQCDGRGENWQR
jgi:hypothetical protein